MDWAHFLFLVMTMMFHCVDGQAGTAANPSLGYTLRENLKATMSVMLLTFFSSFVFMGIFSLYIRHCSHRYHGRRLEAATDTCGRSGANRQVIDKCPVLVYSAVKELKIGRGTLECAVCLSEFEDYDNIRLLPKCHHVFHQDCVDEWLLPHMSCPVCRAALTLTSDPRPDAIPLTTTETVQQQNQLQQNGLVEVVVRDDVAGGEIGEAVTIPPRKLARSHSTGHSVVEFGDVVDRYTLSTGGGVGRFAASDVVLAGAWSWKRVWLVE